MAYPRGVKGVMAGQGDTCEEAAADLESALKFHLETFGPDTLNVEGRTGNLEV